MVLDPLVLSSTSGTCATASGSLTFIGNATVLLDLGGMRVLTDPNFLHQGQHAKLGYGLRSRRLKDPAMSLDEVLPVDLVVLSHHHGDHFDEVAAHDLPKDVPIVSTPHACRKLGRQGFTRTHALETWQSQPVVGGGVHLSVTGLPAQHAPNPVNRLLPPVMGSLLDVSVGAGSYRIYVSGDTLVHDALAEIPRRYPGIDLAVLHLGGTRIAGITLSMDGEAGARALAMLDPDEAVPVHFDDYTVFTSPVEEFEAAVRRQGLRTRVHRLDRGQTMRWELSRGRTR